MTPQPFAGVRRPDWPELLAAYVQARVTAPFRWGQHDCVAFALGAVEAMTGQHPARAWLPAYATRRQALRTAAEVGGLTEAFGTVFGPPIKPTMARLGDLGFTEPGALLVCNGAVWLGAGRQGLHYLPLPSVATAWRAG